MYESRSTSPQSSYPWYCSAFQWSVGLGNRNLVSALVVVDWKLKVVGLFDCCKNVVYKNTTNEQIRYLWEKYIKHDKNKIIIVCQWTISENVPLHLYLSIIWMRTIFITHCSNIYCRTSIRNNLLWIILHLKSSTLRGPLLYW